MICPVTQHHHDNVPRRLCIFLCSAKWDNRCRFACNELSLLTIICKHGNKAEPLCIRGIWGPGYSHLFAREALAASERFSYFLNRQQLPAQREIVSESVSVEQLSRSRPLPYIALGYCICDSVKYIIKLDLEVHLRGLRCISDQFPWKVPMEKALQR